MVQKVQKVHFAHAKLSIRVILSSDQLLFHKKLLQEDEDTSQKCREKQECVSNFNPGQKISPAQFLAQEEII
jgi:hypothetical protein